MPVDTSIYQNRTPPDPIAGLGGTVGLANALTNNQILNAQNQRIQGEVQGQGQFGQALIDANGNPVAAMNKLAGPGGNLNPLYAGTAYERAAALGGAQIGNANALGQGAQARAANFYARLNALGATGTAQTQDYAGLINEGLSTGDIMPADGTAILAHLPRGQKAQAAFIANRTAGFTTPAEQTAPAQIGMTNTLQPILGTGARQAAQARTQGGTVIGPPPGAVGATEAVGTESGRQLAADRAANANFTQQILPLRKAITSLDALGTTGTGPGTEQRNQIVSFLQSLGVPGINTENIKNYDEANKYLTDWVNQNGNTGTNDKLAAAFAGNPNVHISNAAASDVAKTALALRRMKLVQERTFSTTGMSPDQYTNKAADWNSQQDPVAYGFDTMTPEAKIKYRQELGPPKPDKNGMPTNPKYLKFFNSYQNAKGLLDAPQATSGAQPAGAQ